MSGKLYIAPIDDADLFAVLLEAGQTTLGPKALIKKMVVRNSLGEERVQNNHAVGSELSEDLRDHLGQFKSIAKRLAWLRVEWVPHLTTTFAYDRAGLEFTPETKGDEAAKEVLARLVDALEERLSFRFQHEALAGSMPAELKAVTHAYERTVGDLRSSALQINGAVADLSQTLSEEFARRLTELGEQMAERRDALESDYAKRSAHLDERETELHAQALEHSKAVAKLQNEEAKHARRQRFIDMRSQLRDRENQSAPVSKETQRKRRPIHALFLVVLALLASGILVFGYRLFFKDSFEWQRLAPFSSSAIGFAAFLFYYIKWMDAWATEHTREEVRRRQFADDIDRADWLAELIFEWRQEYGQEKEFPAELQSALCRGLFDSEADFLSASHPLETLMNLARRTSVKVSPDSVEVGTSK